MYEHLNDDNYLIFCAKHYKNPQSYSTEEFFEDIQRIKYVKKLITRYIQYGDLKERLILNHLIILLNVFGPEQLPRIIYLKCKPQFRYLKPFLLLLNILPTKIYNINTEMTIDLDGISMDQNIIATLRAIKDE